MDAVAFSYTPIPYTAESKLKEAQKRDLFLVGSSPQRSSQQSTQLSNSVFNSRQKRDDVVHDLWPLLHEQVYLGMIASRTPLKAYVTRDIEQVLTRINHLTD